MTELTEKAQRLLADRMNAIEPVGTAAEQVAAAKEQLRTAEAALRTAWKVALGAGWTAAELKQLDLREPAPAPRGGRPAGSRSRTKDAARAAAAGAAAEAGQPA